MQPFGTLLIILVEPGACLKCWKPLICIVCFKWHFYSDKSACSSTLCHWNPLHFLNNNRDCAVVYGPKAEISYVETLKLGGRVPKRVAFMVQLYLLLLWLELEHWHFDLSQQKKHSWIYKHQQQLGSNHCPSNSEPAHTIAWFPLSGMQESSIHLQVSCYDVSKCLLCNQSITIEMMDGCAPTEFNGSPAAVVHNLLSPPYHVALCKINRSVSLWKLKCANLNLF